MSGVASGFIVGNDNYTVPVGSTLLILQTMTWDRQNLNGTFIISATGYSESVQADASGRATKLVPAGATYTVSLQHQGAYLNDGPQTVVAAAEEIAWVTFTLSEPAVVTFDNVTASSWVSDSTYPDFPYRCAIPLSGVTATDVPLVVFDVEQSTSGEYAPIAQSYNGGIYVWSTKSVSVTIPSILVMHQA